MIEACTEEQWTAAYQAAENNDWCEIDSMEDGDGGPLAAYVAQQYTHEKVEQEEGILWAAIKVAGQLWDRWDSSQFETVLRSYDGNKQNDIALLVQEYLNEHHENYPISEVRDVNYWFNNHVVGETSVCAPDQPDGDTLHFFKRIDW